MIIVTDNGVIDTGDHLPPPHERFRFLWAGSDGQEWDLCAGPAVIQSGARGFGLPTPQHWSLDSVLDGSTWQGLRIPAREVYMPVVVKSKTWIDTERSFFTGLDPRTEGRLRVVTPDASWREIVCRYVEGAEGEYDLDPLLYGRAAYPIRMTAADPYWLGEPVVADYPYTVDSASFFPGTPFTIVPTRTTTNATVTNPGDVDSTAVWRVTGPFTGFTVGVGESLVEVAHTAEAGEWVEIDLDPRRLTVVDQAGTDLWDAVTTFSRAVIPPGDDVALATELRSPQVGASVQLSFTPRYWRAW